MSRYRTVIGRAEYVDFVGSATVIPAKIDSGAFRSAVHATNVKEVSRDGKKLLQFELLGHPCSKDKFPLTVRRFTKVKVTSSNGKSESRYEVTLKIKLANKIYETSFTLADRSKNVYPVLIGRKALRNRFLVDVANTPVTLLELKKNFGVLAPEDEEDLEN